MSRFLGIDTSCYTTSVAVFDDKQGIVAEDRIVLSVKQGHRGLAQSEMVFQHIRNLPILLSKIGEYILNIEGIGVSIFPRRRADSYMPAFLAGKSVAKAISIAKDIPMYDFSHQENHALAALRLAPNLWGQPFYMMHVSGGTQDVLAVHWNGAIMSIEDLIHSKDITAGQFIDRVGVALGLSFPAGAKLEALALEEKQKEYHVPHSKIKDAFSFAGPETQVERDIKQGDIEKSAIAYGVLQSVGDAFRQVLMAYPFQEGYPFIAVGGVMSNCYLRKVIQDICEAKKLSPYFADVKYSSDNATGNAFGAYMRKRYESLHTS